MTIRIDARRMIPGRGEPVADATVIIEGRVITYAGPTDEAPHTPSFSAYTTDVVMPGMWEAHAHFWGTASANIESLVTHDPHVGVLRAANDVRILLEAGFTSVREVGGYGVYLSTAIEEGTITGPTVYASGSILSQTGGHGDIHGLSIPHVDELFERHFGAPTLCDGPDACRRLVRRQLRLGARVIKVCASGGVMSQVDHPIHQQFSVEELKAIVEEATRADRIVAAHCHGKPGIMAALEAGCRTIEHGSYLDEEAAAAMVEAGAVLVPTRFIVQHLVDHGMEVGMPDYAYAKIVAIADLHFQAMQTAIAAGVTIATGTDIFVRSALGRNGRELGYLVEAGMKPLQAIEAATANGPLTVGPQAPSSGQLMKGFDADVICVDANPLDDIGVLAVPDHVTHVFKAGQIVKDGG
ncbi:MAG: amidohydrolase family protein [Acidimicrobiia bacterium]